MAVTDQCNNINRRSAMARYLPFNDSERKYNTFIDGINLAASLYLSLVGFILFVL